VELVVCQILTASEGPSRSFALEKIHLILKEISWQLAVAVTTTVIEFGLSTLNRQPIAAGSIGRR
jgi:hypothetical protein